MEFLVADVRGGAVPRAEPGPGSTCWAVRTWLHGARIESKLFMFLCPGLLAGSGKQLCRKSGWEGIVHSERALKTNEAAELLHLVTEELSVRLQGNEEGDLNYFSSLMSVDSHCSGSWLLVLLSLGESQL